MKDREVFGVVGCIGLAIIVCDQSMRFIQL